MFPIKRHLTEVQDQHKLQKNETKLSDYCEDGTRREHDTVLKSVDIYLVDIFVSIFPHLIHVFHSCCICFFRMLISAFFSYIWFRIQIFLLRSISAIRFRYVQYKHGQLLPKPSLVETIPIGDHFIRALIYLPLNYASHVTPYPLHIDFHGGRTLSASL